MVAVFLEEKLFQRWQLVVSTFENKILFFRKINLFCKVQMIDLRKIELQRIAILNFIMFHFTRFQFQSFVILQFCILFQICIFVEKILFDILTILLSAIFSFLSESHSLACAGAVYDIWSVTSELTVQEMPNLFKASSRYIFQQELNPRIAG